MTVPTLLLSSQASLAILPLTLVARPLRHGDAGGPGRAARAGL